MLSSTADRSCISIVSETPTWCLHPLPLEEAEQLPRTREGIMTGRHTPAPDPLGGWGPHLWAAAALVCQILQLAFDIWGRCACCA